MHPFWTSKLSLPNLLYFRLTKKVQTTMKEVSVFSHHILSICNALYVFGKFLSNALINHERAEVEFE
jgi:hypothetical protein